MIMKNHNSAGGVKKSSGHLNDLEHTKSVVERIVSAGMDITSEYNNWVSIAFAFAGFGEEGRSLFHDVSRLNPKYDWADCDVKFTNCLRSAQQRLEGNGGSETVVSIATFMKIAQEHGIDISLPEELKGKRGRPRKQGAAVDDVPPIVLTIEYINSHYDLRFNEITFSIEYRSKEDAEGKWFDMDDREFDTLYSRLKSRDIGITVTDLRAVLKSKDISSEYNPMEDYLSSLPEWDRKTDYIEQFFDNIKFRSPEDRAFCMPLLRKWFINMVALALGKAKDNQLVPVYVGRQHVGKTYFCFNILPPCLRKYGNTFIPGGKLDKDVLIAMSRFAHITFDEFVITRQTSSQIKAIISSRDPKVRPSYGYFHEEFPRRASLSATSNEERYIDKSDGDRRYLTINIVGTTNPLCLPYEGAYAQAYWIVCNEDESCYLTTAEDSESISERNKNHTVLSLCESAIMDAYRKPLPGEDGEMMSASQILGELSARFHSPELNVINIGKALNALQFGGKKYSDNFKYHVVRKRAMTDEEIKAEASAYRKETEAAMEAERKAQESQKQSELDSLQGRLDFDEDIPF